ncbi:EamA family transporter [Undibacterium cyanobacteriorum]|uniref:EamA family transporter n=1 Tax=Undibacterium cyanobacteriorum TaxID=3073561 RepID=A0ABY9RKS5_9BURK|nr:EamA family transporter [Undibacterium sp. 20NA77.5]WMW81439.1 EamA family transporter [Undibacterium sp. 20NA77.5]
MPSYLLFIIASLIWGSTFWAITQQLGQVAPAVSVAYRFGLAAACLFAWCIWRGHKIKLPWRQHRWLMLHGFCTFSLSYVCTYSSEQYVVSALVAVLFSLMVIWSPILERIFLGRALSAQIWLAASVSIGGVILLFYPTLRENFGSGHPLAPAELHHFVFGIALALTATLASTFGNLVVIKVRELNQDVLGTMAWAMAWGTFFISLYAIFKGESWSIPHTLQYWGALLYLSIFGSVIAFACYFTLINRIGAQKTVFIGVITPLISVLLSIQLENYRPGWIEWLGMLLCLSGVAWAMLGKKVSPRLTAEN